MALTLERARKIPNSVLTDDAAGPKYVNVNNIHIKHFEENRMEVVQKLDEYGKAGWLTAMILGFVVFWPIGLCILFYLLGSGRMGNWKYANTSCWTSDGEGRSGRSRSRGRHRSRHHRPRSSGNTAFDTYREETLKRLEDEQAEFNEYLDHLRQAKDKTEFDAFMAQRKDRPAPEIPEEDRPEA